MTAEQWSTAVSEVLGGKAGGKEPTRQGAGTQPEKLDDAVAQAEKWLADKVAELKI